jgi:SAM-dependent methyltransferase
MEREIYDAFYEAEDRHWWFLARRRILMRLLERMYPDGGLAVADVGCGTGGMALPLARLGSVTAVDDAEAAREYCRRRGLERVLSTAEWERQGERYDLITAFDVVEHVRDDVAFLADLHARLRSGGTLVVTVPAYRFLWSPFDEMNHHQRRYARGELRRRLGAAGFRIRRITYFNSALFPAVAAVRLVERALRLDPTDPEERRRAIGRWFKVGPLNGILTAIFASEAGWLARGDLPFGCSILAVAVKEAS